MSATHTNLLYHLIFSTKQRVPFITVTVQNELYQYIGGIVRGEKGVLLEAGGMPDHVHLLAKFSPTMAVSDMLRKIKANSSKWMNEKGRLRKFGWQDGYAAFSVSESQVPIVSRYIRNQATHHRKLEFKSELIALLKRHRIEFEERYLWD
jgi:putative transposase